MWRLNCSRTASRIGFQRRLHQAVTPKASKKNPEGVARHGLKKCGHCRKQFTVRVKKRGVTPEFKRLFKRRPATTSGAPSNGSGFCCA